MTEWEVLLLGRLGAAPPRVVAGHEPSGIARVFAASAALQTALAAAGREALERLARHWLEEYADDVSGMAPDTARELLWELAELAREAKALRQALYCWMC
jgi:hypothetical protein